MFLFFDLDATLLDHDAAARAGATRFFETYRTHFQMELADFLARWEAAAEKYFQTGEAGREANHTQSRRGRMRDLFSERLSNEEADRRFKAYLETYESHWRLFEDSLPCLEKLRGFPLGLITNGTGKQQRSKIQKMGLAPYLSHVIISREVDCAKPDKAIFELAASQAGVEMRDCVYVGDRLRTDAQAAREAGMKGIWLDRKNQWNGAEVGVPAIQSLADLPGLLEEGGVSG